MVAEASICADGWFAGMRMSLDFLLKKLRYTIAHGQRTTMILLISNEAWLSFLANVSSS